MAPHRSSKRGLLSCLLTPLAVSALAPAQALTPEAVRHELEAGQHYAPILWLATDERLYPMLPHAFAFDGIDNDGDGLKDLDDLDEIRMDDLDLARLNALVERLRGFTFSCSLSGADDLEGRPRSRPPVASRALQKMQYVLPFERRKSGLIRPAWRKYFRMKGVPLSAYTTIVESGHQEWEITSYEFLNWLDPRLAEHLRPGPAAAELIAALAAKGIPFQAPALAWQDSAWFVAEPRRTQNHPPRGIFLYPQDGRLGIYDRLHRETYQAQRPQGAEHVVITHESRLPKPRIVYFRPEQQIHDRFIHEYWFYYLFDIGTGAHPHDGEHAFVFSDSLGDVVGVVGSGHTKATANNVLVVGGTPRPDRQLPAALPNHMPFLVELGKHASAPDRSFDGRFQIGIDANAMYMDVWGSRDIAAATGVDKIKRFATEFSFPRDETTLIFEHKWHATRRAWADTGWTADADPAYVRSLTAVDLANMKKYDHPTISRYGPGYEVYRLFPLRLMTYLVDTLLVDPAISEETVADWLTEYREFFWELPPEEIKISSAALAEMRKWPARKSPNRDLWLHNDYRHPNDVFKLWLFPRWAFVFTYLSESSLQIGRIGMQFSNVLGMIPFSSAEVFADFDLEGGEIHDLGFSYNFFRGRHQGWYGGLSWGGVAKGPQDHVAAAFGFVPISWDLKSLPVIGRHLWHAQFALRAGLRGEIYLDSRPWNINPLKFQLGVGVTRTILGPRHPLTY